MVRTNSTATRGDTAGSGRVARRGWGRRWGGRGRSARMQGVQMLVGLAATIVVAVLCVAGVMDVLERPTLDVRARWFDRFSPPASDEIVIAGIDDRALREVQSWPWDRVYLAEAVKELTREGAKVIALDVLIEESQPPRAVPGDDAMHPRLGFRSGDEALAKAIAGHGRVVAPVRFSQYQAGGRAEDFERVRRGTLTREVARNAGEPFDARQAKAALEAARQRIAVDGTWGGKALTDTEQRAILADARVLSWQAGQSRVRFDLLSLVELPAVGVERLPIEAVGMNAARLGDVSLTTQDEDAVLRAISPVVLSGGAWGNFALVAALMQLGEAFAPTFPTDTKVRLGGRDAARGGDVGDDRGYVWRLPQTMLTWPKGGREFAGQFTPDSAKPQEISLATVLAPVLRQRGARTNLLAIAELLEQAAKLGLHVGEEAAPLALAMAAKEDVVEDPAYAADLTRLKGMCTPLTNEAAEFLEFLKEDEGGEAVGKTGNETRDRKGSAAAELDPETAARVRLLESAAVTLPQLITACEEAPAEVAKARAILRPIVDGKLVFVGWTSTGTIADVVATSINSRTPGVYVHAAAANAMLTGFMRRPAPVLFDLAAMLALGAIGTLLAVRLSMSASPVALGIVLVGWFVVCGVGLWDYAHVVASCSGPMLTAGSGWLAAVLHRGLVEQRARRRTEEQFRAYVSPEVVDVLVEHPELQSLSPQKRELTVMMADLEGFTALAERLGEERTGRMLGTYLGEMTRILLRHGATIDKYLGDGIMAFWGAPIEMAPERQAASACAAAAEMQRRLAAMNASGELESVAADVKKEAGRPAGAGEGAGAARGHGGLRLRIGIACGPLMVGDFGCPPTRSSYTVIGDAANLASRLERACKSLGVRVLVSNEVRERAARWRGSDAAAGNGGATAMETMGAIRLRGRERIEEVWTPRELGTEGVRMEEALTLAGQGVRAYREGRLDDAQGTFERLNADPSFGRLAGVYLLAITANRAKMRSGRPENGGPTVAPAEFDGTIDVTDV